MPFVEMMPARASLSLHAAAEAVRVESVMIPGRRLPCLVRVGSSREAELQVLRSPRTKSLREVL